MRDLIDKFKAAAWPRRIAMIIVGIIMVAGSLYAIRVWVIPNWLRATAILARIAINYAFLTMVVYLFSPSTGKKMVDLGFAIVERLLIDPLLLLFRAGSKKKKKVN